MSKVTSKLQGEIKKPKYPKYVTVIVAPGISVDDCAVLRKDYDERKGALVKNYVVQVTTVELDRGSRLLAVAPGIPQSEVKELQKHLKRAEKDPSYTVVVNYDVSVWSIPKRQAQV